MRLLLVALLCSLDLSAQSTAGRLSGNVTDPSGAAVPAVRVTAINSETGQKLAERTNAEGNFVIYPLPPGIYDISAQKDGFATLTMSGVKIDVSESVVRNFRLQVGAITQSVSVTAETESVQTDSPSVEATILPIPPLQILSCAINAAAP